MSKVEKKKSRQEDKQVGNEQINRQTDGFSRQARHRDGPMSKQTETHKYMKGVVEGRGK